MSRRKHLKYTNLVNWVFNSAFVLVCAGLATLLITDPFLMSKISTTFSVNRSNKPVEISNGEFDGKANKVEQFNVVGMTTKLDFSDLDSAADKMGLLWDEFYKNGEIQNAVNWSSSPSPLAVYSDFSAGGNTANLIVGYDDKDLLKNHGLDSQSVSGGLYSEVGLSSPTFDGLSEAWLKFDFAKRPPRIVIEHYSINAIGQITHITMQAMYK